MIIESHNLIPFEARWMVVTEKNRLVSELMLSPEKFYPTENKKKYKFKISVKDHINELINNYLELRVDYYSIYYAELNNPKELKGEIVKKYRLGDGVLYTLD